MPGGRSENITYLRRASELSCPGSLPIAAKSFQNCSGRLRSYPRYRHSESNEETKTLRTWRMRVEIA